MLAILAPYDRSETTLAALRVADLALACGVDVYYLVSGTKGQGIHRYWDTKSISRKCAHKLQKLAPAKFKHIVAFGYVPYHNWFYLPRTDLTNKTTFLDMVISPYEIQRSEAEVWSCVHRVICPSAAVHRLASGASFLSTVNGEVTTTKLSWASGDSSFPAPISSPLRFAAICDSGCLREFPEQWFHTVNQFLNNTDNHIVDCYLTCSLPKRCRTLVRDMQIQHAGRFQTHAPMFIQDLVVWLRDRDIAVYPSCRTSFGFYPAMCRSMRMPLLAINIDPIKEIIQHGISGHLVDMPMLPEPCGVERASFNASSFLDGWYRCAEKPQTLWDRVETADKLRVKQEHTFNEFWRLAWAAIMV